MAEEKSKSNSEANVENQNQQGKESDKEKDNSQKTNVDLDKVLKENEGLRQAQSTLTKKLEELANENKGFKENLAKALGLGGGEDNKQTTTDELLQTALSKISDLEKGNKKAQAKEMLNRLITELSDDGKEVDSKVKEFLRSELDADEPDEEKIKEVVIKKYTSIKNLLGGKINLASDKSPNQKATAGNFSKNPNANEILESQGLKININRR